MFEFNIELFNKAHSQLSESIDLFSDNSDLLSQLRTQMPNSFKNESELIAIIEDYIKCIKDNIHLVQNMIAINSRINETMVEKESEKKEGFFSSTFNAIKDTCCSWGNGISSVFRGEGFYDLGEAFVQTGATLFVTKKSVENGILKVGETVIDGVSYIGGMSISGWTSLFNRDVSENIKNSTMNFIRKDIVGDNNRSFYEDTSIGKFINLKSNLKYDSAAAEGIQVGTEFVSKIALATAATVLSGGTAAVAIGAIYGVGSEEEKYAQSVNIDLGENYNYKKSFGKAIVGGVGGAAEFYGYGQLGAGIYNGINALKSGVSVANNARITSDLSTSFGKNFARNFFMIDTLLDTGAVVTKHGINYAIGDESLNDLIKFGGTELAFSLGLAAVGSGIGAYVDTKSARRLLNEKTLKQLGSIPSGFDNYNQVAEYFGDSNLYLVGNMQEQVKKGKIDWFDYQNIKRDLYHGDEATISMAKSYLNADQLSTYNSLVDNYSNSIQNRWIEKLTEREKTSIMIYAKDFGSFDGKTTMNDMMRSGLSEGSTNLDSAIEKFGKLEHEIVTYRNVGLDALTSQFDDVSDLKSLIGKTYSDKSYMSSSLLEFSASSFISENDNVLLKIRVPNDANYGAYIEPLSQLNYGQMEFLIKKNSTSIIENAFKDVDGNIVVEMTLCN
ncbi:MAG: ADP-ribosyltransferase [Bacilli bacterium]|nr:ADP-ribosyltransferase [Bacilli bacterium]